MTGPTIETVANHLDKTCDPVVGIKINDSDPIAAGHDPSAAIVQDRVDGIFSADSIILRAKDIPRFIDLIGGADNLPADVQVFASEDGSNPGIQHVWGTSLNSAKDIPLDDSTEKQSHGITTERQSPIFTDDIIIDFRYW